MQPCGVILFLAWLIRYGTSTEIWAAASETAESRQAKFSLIRAENRLESSKPSNPKPQIWPALLPAAAARTAE